MIGRSRVIASAALLVMALDACGPAQTVDPAPLSTAPQRAAVTTATPRAAAERAAPRAKGPPPPAAMRALLDVHNQLRARHCAPPLSWSPRLAQRAQAWASRLGRGCLLEHSGGKVGENLAAATAGSMSAADVVRLWHAESRGYSYRRGGFSMSTGHFTQLVWRSTAQLGCGTSLCRGLQIWVCNYNPPGNVQGDYARNVLPTCGAR